MAMVIYHMDKTYTYPTSLIAHMAYVLSPWSRATVFVASSNP